LRGKEIEKKGKCLVKWEKVCKPKNAGGLGVLHLRTHCSYSQKYVQVHEQT
jgi:hypothetical protein